MNNPILLLITVPFSWLYEAVTRFRNFLYNVGLKKSFSFSNQAVIAVGNLSVGGTGKSPMIEYLVRLLSPNYSVAILSRGYGRKTNGFRLASEKENATTIGDEPFQFYKKFAGKIEIAVCENRVIGINQLLSINKNIQVILLDDAFQHRRVKPMFSILLTDFSKPFFNDFVLPKGRLRERRKGSQRTDVVVVTKCNSLTEQIQSDYKNKIQLYTGEKPVFFSSIEYDESTLTSINKDIVLVTGIANSKSLVEFVSKKFNLKQHFEFADHYDYSQKEVDEIQRKAISLNTSILTTEKDFVKVETMADKKLWFYLPIKTHFINHTDSDFDALVLQKVKNHLSV